MSKIIDIEIKKDKNGNNMKVCQFDQPRANVYVNEKYNASQYESVEVGKEFPLVKDGNFWKIDDGTVGAPRTASTTKRSQEIRQAQDHKAESIAWFNATNSAVAVVTKLYAPDTSVDILREEIANWRDWFLQQWKDQPPF